MRTLNIILSMQLLRTSESSKKRMIKLNKKKKDRNEKVNKKNDGKIFTK